MVITSFTNKMTHKPTHSTSYRIRGFCAVLPLLILTHTMPCKAIEEPAYTIEQTIDAIEIRRYSAYTVAQVIIESSTEDAGNQAFPILAGYIFGKNKGERKLAMTTPVIQTAEPVKLAMTAPVIQTQVQGNFIVQFVLPKGVTVSNAPEPIDPRITLHEMPAVRLAAIRYSGFWSEANYKNHLLKLQASLKTANLEWEGEPIYSRYNPPTTPWFIRRNEIWLRLAKQ